MSYEIDRNPAVQPSLAEMTQKALDLLSANAKKGFILMVEGSRIDMAAHSNDPGSHFHDIVAYESALEVIQNFIKKHPETVVISVSDHETGGLALGRNFNNYTYPEYEWYPKVVLDQQISTEAMANLIIGGQSITQVLASQAGIVDLTAEEISMLQNVTSNAGVLTSLIGDVISYRARIGWSTWGHTAVDINLYATGDKSEKFHGNYKNYEIGNLLSDLFNFDLKKITESLKDVSPFSTDFTPSNTPKRYGLHD